MRFRTGFQRAPLAALAFFILLPLGMGRADIVTLNSGATIHGRLVGYSGTSKSVTLRTSSGTLLVFDRDSVKQVKHGADPGQVAAGAKPASKGLRLTAEEEAWMPKIRLIASRLLGTSRDQSRSARAELLRIEDPDALPALTRYLASHPLPEARLLFVTIARGIHGAKPVYYLVALSLYDPSPQVREEARNAIGPERADFARPLYIEALKTREQRLATLAAKGIAEIGDPNSDAVPYLIDALEFRAAQPVELSPSRVFLLSCPSCAESRAVALTYRVVDIPALNEVAYVKDRNLAVLDTLTKVTDRKLGYSRDEWRSWWANEKKNRDLQKSSSEDRVVLKRSSPL
ncbi:MAG TPA: hypothetical protein VG055_15670 [Planctomycetaceae bacterium]|jgi:hypothetical protein|nr:hypothetical protein [Planctomycetaceae bacterium]